MVDEGDLAPNLTIPAVTEEITTTSLAAQWDEGPAVLVFFPGAFSGTCTAELTTFDRRLEEFTSVGARVVGITVDTPWVLAAFRDRHDLSLPLLGDIDHATIRAFDATTAIPDLEMDEVASRTVIIVETDGTIAWRWDGDLDAEPEYDTVLDAARDV